VTWNSELEGRVVHRLHYSAETDTLTHTEHRVDTWNDRTGRLTFTTEQGFPEAAHNGLKYGRLGQFNFVGGKEVVLLIADLRATNRTYGWLHARLTRLYRKGLLTHEQ